LVEVLTVLDIFITVTIQWDSLILVDLNFNNKGFQENRFFFEIKKFFLTQDLLVALTKTLLK